MLISLDVDRFQLELLIMAMDHMVHDLKLKSLPSNEIERIMDLIEYLKYQSHIHEWRGK